MKKALVAAVLAACVSVGAYADVSVPATTADGNPVSVVLSGTVDLSADLTVSSVTETKDKTTTTTGFKLNLNDAKAALEVSTPFGENSVTGKLAFKSDDGKIVLDNAFLTVANDAFGSLSVGQQDNAAASLAVNGFDGYDFGDLLPLEKLKEKGIQGYDFDDFFPSLSFVDAPNVMFTSPDYNGMSYAVSVALSVSKTTDQDAEVTHEYSLAAAYSNDAFSGAVTLTVNPFKTDKFDGVNVAASVGATFAVENTTLLANVTVVNNPQTKDDSLLTVAGQLGAQFAATEQDTVSFALQGKMFKALLKDSSKKFPTFYAVGAKAAFEHAFNDTFTAYVYGRVGYTSVTKVENEDFLPSKLDQGYGAGLKLEF